MKYGAPAALLLAAIACRQPILQALGSALVVHEPTSECDAIWVLSGSDRYLEAAKLAPELGAQRVILSQHCPGPIEQLGVVPTLEVIGHRELCRHGVDEGMIHVVAGEPRNRWEIVRQFADWLRKAPEQQVVVLCDRFNSRDLRCLLDGALEQELAARVRIHVLTDSRYDETNWWRSRRGVKSCFGGWFVWIWDCFVGPPTQEPRDFDADQFEDYLSQGADA